MQNMRRFMIRERIALQFYARSAGLADFTKNERTLTNCQGGLPQVAWNNSADKQEYKKKTIKNNLAALKGIS